LPINSITDTVSIYHNKKKKLFSKNSKISKIIKINIKNQIQKKVFSQKKETKTKNPKKNQKNPKKPKTFIIAQK